MRNHTTNHSVRDALSRWPGLGACTNRELDDLAHLVDEMTFEPGRVLMRAGDHGEEAFMILDGKVEVEVDGKVVATLGPERFVGEMALLENNVRTATVTCITETKTLVLSRRAFQTIVSKPHVATRIATELARKVRALESNPR